MSGSGLRDVDRLAGGICGKKHSGVAVFSIGQIAVHIPQNKLDRLFAEPAAFLGAVDGPERFQRVAERVHHRAFLLIRRKRFQHARIQQDGFRDDAFAGDGLLGVVVIDHGVAGRLATGPGGRRNREELLLAET